MSKNTLQWFHLLEAQEPQLTLHHLPATWEAGWCSLCPSQWQIHFRALTRSAAMISTIKIRHNSSQCNLCRILIDSSHMREVAAVHISTCDNPASLQLSVTTGISWTPPFTEASRCWQNSSSSSQHRRSLLPVTWFWCSDSASSGVTGDGQCASLVHRAGIAAARAVRELSRGWLTQKEECELCSPRPSDNKWQRCCCTGGGRGRHHLICCLLGAKLATWVEQVPSCPSLLRVPSSHLHYARSWDRQAGKEEMRSKGCEEQLVPSHQTQSLLGLKHRV